MQYRARLMPSPNNEANMCCPLDLFQSVTFITFGTSAALPSMRCTHEVIKRKCQTLARLSSNQATPTISNYRNILAISI